MNQAEPAPAAGQVRPPAWLKGKGRSAWKWIAPGLEKMGCLTTADPHALALLCDAYAEYIQAREIVRLRGATYESRRSIIEENAEGKEELVQVTMIRPRPEVAISSDAWKRVRAMMLEFGLTPSSRSRIATGDAKGNDDPFADWMKHGSSSSS